MKMHLSKTLFENSQLGPGVGSNLLLSLTSEESDIGKVKVWSQKS